MSRYRLQHWRNRAQSFYSDLPPEISEWLFDSSSLTARLLRHCHGDFHVRVLSQGYGHATLSERRTLFMQERQHALLREVHLYCGDVPVVYARTVIPVTTLIGPQRKLAHLGDKPLGAVLFSDPSMQRDEVEIARLRGDQVKLNIPGDEVVWGRRSVFKLNHRPLLVSEYFLPALFE